MIDKEYGQLILICDQCDTLAQLQVGNDWDELMDWMRWNGWTKMKTEDGEWEHYCEGCSGD
jgi:hypothetical protein